MLRHAKKRSKDVCADMFFFTSEDVQKFLNNAKTSKALGPDGISNIMLKHLGSHAINYLAALFTLSIRTHNFPSIWKVARIIPLLKPGKSSDDAS